MFRLLQQGGEIQEVGPGKIITHFSLQFSTTVEKESTKDPVGERALTFCLHIREEETDIRDGHPAGCSAPLQATMAN